MIDTHTHLNFKAFKDDWREVVDRALQAGVSKMIVVGTDIESSRRAIEMANDCPAIFASVGIHPHHSREFLISKSESQKDPMIPEKIIQIEIDTIRELALQPKVVAIGELGLDYHEYKSEKYTSTSLRATPNLKLLQKELFRMQIELAADLGKPLIIHSREARKEVLNVLRAKGTEHRVKLKGVFHCFEGSASYLKKVLEAGFYISFTGNITHNHGLLKIVSSVPLDRLLLETDCPFMTPEPYRGTRNEPSYVKIVAKQHASSRSIQFTKVVQQTTQNAHELFEL